MVWQRSNTRYSYGLYRRHEIIDGIKEGALIKFDQELYYKMNPISASVARVFEQITGKKEIIKKWENVKPQIYVEFAGYRNGEPIIVLRNINGKIITASAFGYRLAERGIKGISICHKVVCSERNMRETTMPKKTTKK